jgi:acyl-CoA synthetase (AMP-forming)/AMP-acid ligase II
MQMTPLQFLQRPDRWLRCLGALGCTIASSPSFGYHHAARTVAMDTLNGCRFDEWRIAFIFAEPVRAADLDEFVSAFGPLGFRRRAFCPSYGLTEAPTMIAGTQAHEEPVALVGHSVSRQADSGDVLTEAVHTASPGDHMIGVGRPLPGVQMTVRLPDDSEAPEGVIGEVWVGGDTLADGYEGGEDFGEWLATGDVGCLRDGVLFIFGRLVDSFNIRGQLITAPLAEQKVQDALPEAGSLLVLPSRSSGAGITVVVEAGQAWPPEVTDQARRTVSELFEHTEVDLLVVSPGGIPRTQQGKPQRREAWARYVLARS